VKILKLSLKNFKGIENFVLETKGGNVSIYGNNATGKTTLFDAFIWLLFDKDSQNRKDFEIKTLDENGEPIHGLDHEVEGVFEIDEYSGEQLTLRKVFSEKWTKKRGSAEKQFTGHTTSYYIDSVPVKKSEYEARIADIVDESIFKLLTNPTFFNEQLHWQKRREILLRVCGDLSDEDVIASDPALAKLPSILNGRKLEGHRKVIQARRSKINKELDCIPVRISEVQNNLPDISGIVPEALPEDIARLRAERQDKQAELAGLENGGEVAEKVRALKEVEFALVDLGRQYQAKADEEAGQKKEEFAGLKEQIATLQADIAGKKREAGLFRTEIQEMEEEVKELRLKWHQVNDITFTFEQSSTCPTCGQRIPEEKLAETREKALADFNLQKANQLEEISNKGKVTKAKLEKHQERLSSLSNTIHEVEDKLTALKQKADALQSEIDTINAKAAGVANDPAYRQKVAEKKALEEEIAKLRAGKQDTAGGIQREIAVIDEAIMALETAQAKVKQYYQGQNRIEELKQQERELAAEYEKLEGELYLTEQFIRTKVTLLEDKIISRFKLAKFRLFNVLINGAVEECCETTYQGVPYSDSLNNGHRIIVGLDIIRTLCGHYNFYPPIFIDNRESVVHIPEMKNQVIGLFVSEKDKSLRVEVAQEEKNKEVA